MRLRLPPASSVGRRETAVSRQHAGVAHAGHRHQDMGPAVTLLGWDNPHTLQ